MHSLPFPGTGDKKISEKSSWHKGEGKQPGQPLSENPLGGAAVPGARLAVARHLELALDPAGCGKLCRIKLLRFLLLKVLQGREESAPQPCWRKRRVSEGQSCECSKEELETWEKRAKIHARVDEHDQLLTCVWNLQGCYLVFFHCPSHHLPPFWALSALGDGQEVCWRQTWLSVTPGLGSCTWATCAGEVAG